MSFSGLTGANSNENFNPVQPEPIYPALMLTDREVTVRISPYVTVLSDFSRQYSGTNDIIPVKMLGISRRNIFTRWKDA